MSRVASAFGEQSPEAVAATGKRGVLQTSAVESAKVEPASFDACCDRCESGESCDQCDAGADTCPLCPLEACGKCAACLRGKRCKFFTRPAPGPPPLSYVPAMPPKFLPVPTQPTLSPARPDAPDAWHGDLESGWRNQIMSPGRD